MKISTRIKRNWWKIFRELYLFINVFFMVFPLLFMLLSATKSQGEVWNNVFGMPADFPGQFVNNLKQAWTGEARYFGNRTMSLTPFPTMLWNTAFITLVTLAVMIVVAMLAGYGVARWNFKGKTAFLLFVLAIQTVPFFGYVIPMLLFGQKLQLTNSLIGIVPVYVGVSAPTAIVLFQSFYKTFPRAIEEAAVIDGCGEVRKFFHIILPMSRGIIAAMAIINFMGYWNEVVIASLFLSDTRLWTISIAVMSARSNSGYDISEYVYALLLLSALPNFVFFTIFSKSIMQGISLGGVKG